MLDGEPYLRGSVPYEGFYGFFTKLLRPDSIVEVDGNNYLGVSARLIRFGSSGLAGVWAEENTRESIYEAFRRKETFGTSGPRIKVRFFAGYNLEGSKLDDLSLIQDAYAKNIPMGGTIIQEKNNSPRFLVWAISDPLGAQKCENTTSKSPQLALFWCFKAHSGHFQCNSALESMT